MMLHLHFSRTYHIINPNNSDFVAIKSQKVPVNKMVRTDSRDPFGRLHAYWQDGPCSQDEKKSDLVSVRYNMLFSCNFLITLLFAPLLPLWLLLLKYVEVNVIVQPTNL